MANNRDDDEFFDDAKKFWENITGRGSGDDDGGQRFLSGEGDEGGSEEYDLGEWADTNLGELLIHDHDHSGAELAFSGYSLDQIQDAIAYCNDAPQGILMIDINGDEIEIYRYPSAGG